MTIDTAINLDYLIPTLRLHLGDTNPTTYRYIDGWIRVALISGVKAMQRWWGDRYLVDIVNNVSRNPDVEFLFDEPNVIQDRDERPIILMASILVKSGQLESNSWNVGSWRDAEIAISNIESSRSKQFGIEMDWKELEMYLMSPTKKLAGALRLPHPSTEE